MMLVLGIIANELDSIGIPYEFMRWTANVEYPYWVGEYTEVPTNYENGYEETTFILTGTTDKSWLDLEEQKELIKQHFSKLSGFIFATENGRGAVFYESSFPVPTGDAALKRIQINLTIKEWKVK